MNIIKQLRRRLKEEIQNQDALAKIESNQFKADSYRNTAAGLLIAGQILTELEQELDESVDRQFIRAFWPMPIDERDGTYEEDDDGERKQIPRFVDDLDAVRRLLTVELWKYPRRDVNLTPKKLMLGMLQAFDQDPD